MYLLDTMLISEPRRPRPAAGVMRFLDQQPLALLYTSVIVVGELRRGAVEQRDTLYGARIEKWIDDDVLRTFAGRVLGIDEETAETWGALRGRAARNGVTLPPVDALIAATAIVHGLTVATRNEADFLRCGVAVRNPWTE